MKTFDENGVLLADVPNANISRPATGQKSGNKNHDIHSGKFGQGGGSANEHTPPPNTSQLDYHRMLDAVREAARTISQPGEDSIRAFIQERASSPDQVDVAQFIQLVNAQRKQDLIDVISHQLAGTSHKVRMQASKVYMRRIIRTLEPNDIAEVVHRLEAMGHDSKKVLKFFPNAPTGLTASDSDVWGIAPPGWVELSDTEIDDDEDPDTEEGASAESG